MRLLVKSLFIGTAFLASHFAYADLTLDNQTEGKHKIQAFYVADEGSGFSGYRFTIDKNPVVLADHTPAVAALYTPGATPDQKKKARELLTKLPLFPEDERDQTVTFLYSNLCPEGALTAQVTFGSELITFCMATDKEIANGKLWIAVVMVQQPAPGSEVEPEQDPEA